MLDQKFSILFWINNGDSGQRDHQFPDQSDHLISRQSDHRFPHQTDHLN
jgi:hypothetical protein